MHVKLTDCNADVYDWLMKHHTTVTSGECKNNKQTHKWHTNSVNPIPTYSGTDMRMETTSQSDMSDSPERTALCCVSLLRA